IFVQRVLDADVEISKTFIVCHSLKPAVVPKSFLSSSDANVGWKHYAVLEHSISVHEHNCRLLKFRELTCHYSLPFAAPGKFLARSVITHRLHIRRTEAFDSYVRIGFSSGISQRSHRFYPNRNKSRIAKLHFSRVESCRALGGWIISDHEEFSCYRVVVDARETADNCTVEHIAGSKIVCADIVDTVD